MQRIMIFLEKGSYLLPGETARNLYAAAAPLPVVDIHTHLDPKRFAENAPFEDFADLWIAADPYKWRAMRMNGIPESVITGSVAPAERFAAWTATLSMLAGNPLFEWSHLELRNFFGIEAVLTQENADSVRRQVNERLGEEAALPRSLLKLAGVETFMTSDGWLDNLEWHRQCREAKTDPKMLPSLRADQALEVDSPGFVAWLGKLTDTTGKDTATLRGFWEALEARLDAFAAVGCRLSDHGIDHLFFEPCSDSEAETLFKKAASGQKLEAGEADALRTDLLVRLAGAYARRGWTMQLHIGAQRKTSSRLASVAGKAGGYACIGSSLDVATLVCLLDAMEERGGLPRTILYPLNPSDYEMLGSLLGSFVEDGVPGKLQLGAAWWFNDHRYGIERHLEAVSAYGLLGRFIGMVTDSRSFLSGVRHEVFRRILCAHLGDLIERGQLPNEPYLILPLLRNVCYNNARQMI